MNAREERAARAMARARGLRGVKVESVAAPLLFPTPRALAARVVELADIRPGMAVLEPSAGTGALLDEIPGGCEVLAIEIVASLAYRLERQYPAARVVQADFLEREFSEYFDRIVMNPPFDHGLDIRHILRARELLALDGRLVAICADGPRQRETFSPIADLYEPLPEGTFAGTGVRTAIVILEAA